MINVNYSEEVIRKAHAIAAEAEEVPYMERDVYCQDRCGLTYEYLRRMGRSFKQPSSRVMMNLGYDIYAKDLATGEFTKLEYNVACDWNPRNPRMNPVSMPVFVKPPSETSISSE